MKEKSAFVDTNLFLRHFMADDLIQSDAASRLFAQAADNEVMLITNVPTVTEFVWVLESVFQLSQPAISEYVFALLTLPGLTVESADVLALAAEYYEEKNIDFVDAYSLAWMKAKELSIAYTFDERHFSRVEGIDVRAPQ